MNKLPRDLDEINAALAEGVRYRHEPDATDPRYEIITLRVPLIEYSGRPRVLDLSGEDAKQKIARYVLATAAAYADFTQGFEGLSKKLWRLAERLAPRAN